MGVTGGSWYASQVAATGGLTLPGSYGPNLARIASDNLMRNEWSLSFHLGELGT